MRATPASDRWRPPALQYHYRRMNSPCHLAAVGDANDPITWSGIPFHFLQEGRKRGLLQSGLPLSPLAPSWRRRRYAWNLWRVLQGERPGGFQYSRDFLEKLWSPFRAGIRGGAVINCFQLFPPSVVADAAVEKWFYIDQTLLQLLDVYGDRERVGVRIARDAVAREREGYQAARGIVAHSRWAAASVVHDYGIPADKVRVVLPGANLDPDAYADWERQREFGAQKNSNSALRLVCVGKNWRRKGIDRLLLSFARARERGFTGALRIIGCPRDSAPAELSRIPQVEWMGFIDKRSQAARFLRAVSECDVGCLLSRAEAGGIAIREYHALGLAVLGTDTGGAPEHMLPAASLALPIEAGTEQIAEQFLVLERDRARLLGMREAAWRQRHSCLWAATVEQFLSFWPHPVPRQALVG